MDSGGTPKKEIHVTLADGTRWLVPGAVDVDRVKTLAEQEWLQVVGPLYMEDRGDAFVRSSAVVSIRKVTKYQRTVT